MHPPTSSAFAPVSAPHRAQVQISWEVMFCSTVSSGLEALSFTHTHGPQTCSGATAVPHATLAPCTTPAPHALPPLPPLQYSGGGDSGRGELCGGNFAVEKNGEISLLAKFSLRVTNNFTARGTIQSPPGNNIKLEDPWRWRKSPAKLSPGNPPPPLYEADLLWRAERTWRPKMKPRRLLQLSVVNKRTSGAEQALMVGRWLSKRWAALPKGDLSCTDIYVPDITASVEPESVAGMCLVLGLPPFGGGGRGGYLQWVLQVLAFY